MAGQRSSLKQIFIEKKENEPGEGSVQSELEKKTAKIAQLEQQISNVSKQQDIDSDSIKILSKTNQALRGQLKEKDATISSLGEHNRDQQLQINQVTARCECLEKENVAYKEQIGELNNRNTTITGQVEELKGAMDGLKYAMEEFTRTFPRSQ